jgi:hypothetical protein
MDVGREYRYWKRNGILVRARICISPSESNIANRFRVLRIYPGKWKVLAIRGRHAVQSPGREDPHDWVTGKQREIQGGESTLSPVEQTGRKTDVLTEEQPLVDCLAVGSS